MSWIYRICPRECFLWWRVVWTGPEMRKSVVFSFFFLFHWNYFRIFLVLLFFFFFPFSYFCCESPHTHTHTLQACFHVNCCGRAKMAFPVIIIWYVFCYLLFFYYFYFQSAQRLWTLRSFRFSHFHPRFPFLFFIFNMNTTNVSFFFLSFSLYFFLLEQNVAERVPLVTSFWPVQLNDESDSRSSPPPSKKKANKQTKTSSEVEVFPV